MSVAEKPFHGCMIALDEIVAPLSGDVSDAVKMWIIAMIDFANDASIGLRSVVHNCHGPVQSHTLDRLVQKGFSGLRVPSCGEAKIDHLPVRVDSPPQVRHLPPTRT